VALFLATACSTPQVTTADKPMADKPVMETMNEAFRANPPKAGPAPSIELGDFQDFKLDNGLRVIVVENNKLPRVSYQLFVDVPPHLEGKYAGTQSMVGDMLRRATSTKSKEEIDEAIDFIGANLSTSGQGAFGSTISKYKETLLDMMAEVVLDARFPAEEFAKVKSEAEANLASQLGNPGAVAGRVQSVLTYGADHPYGELTTEESLKNITVDVVKNYYDAYFVPNRSYLVMVGDLTRAEAEKLAKGAFSDWKEKEVVTPAIATPTRPTGVTVNFVPRAGSVQSNIIISHPVDVKPGTEKAIEASIANSILGSGFGGRLFQNLREDKAYTYGANSSVRPSEVIGQFSAFSDVRNEVTDSAVTEFMMELNKISIEEVTDDELARTKSQIAGSFGRALESPNRIARYALNTIRYGLDRDYYPNYLKEVADIDKEDVLDVAVEVINPMAGTNIIVVGDKAVAEKLAKFATDGKVRYFDANGKTVNMEDMAAPTDVTPKQIIEGYIKAIGGKDAIMKVKNFSSTMEASVQGQTMTQTIAKADGNKIASSMTMMGMTMMDQKYNDGKATMMQQGQKVPLDDAAIAAMSAEAELFPVAALLNDLSKVTLEGTESINGKPALVLSVMGADGNATKRYFDKESMLQVRQVQQQGPMTIVTDISDYKAIDGVMFPHKMSLTGAAPFPIVMEVKETKVNGEIDPMLFEIKE